MERAPHAGPFLLLVMLRWEFNSTVAGHLCVTPANPALFWRNAVVRFGGICISLLCVDGVNSPLSQLPIGL